MWTNPSFTVSGLGGAGGGAGAGAGGGGAGGAGAGAGAAQPLKTKPITSANTRQINNTFLFIYFTSSGFGICRLHQCLT